MILLMLHEWFVELFCRRNLIEVGIFRWKKDGMKVFLMENWVYFHRIMLHGLLKRRVRSTEGFERNFFNDWIDNKKDPPVKRKPINGLGALINKEVSFRKKYSWFQCCIIE
jgi:hypothetical protein